MFVLIEAAKKIRPLGIFFSLLWVSGEENVQFQILKAKFFAEKARFELSIVEGHSCVSMREYGDA
jgi:hypothetical protein